MWRAITLALPAIGLLAIALPCAAESAGSALLKDGDSVLFIGNSYVGSEGGLNNHFRRTVAKAAPPLTVKADWTSMYDKATLADMLTDEVSQRIRSGQRRARRRPERPRRGDAAVRRPGEGRRPAPCVLRDVGGQPDARRRRVGRLPRGNAGRHRAPAALREGDRRAGRAVRPHLLRPAGRPAGLRRSEARLPVRARQLDPERPGHAGQRGRPLRRHDRPLAGRPALLGAVPAGPGAAHRGARLADRPGLAGGQGGRQAGAVARPYAPGSRPST